MTFSIFIVAFFVAASQVKAEIIFSEIYPAPDNGYEWVELCNTSDNSIDLSEYSLYDAVGKELFVPPIMLQPDQYVLATASSVLNNGGDSIFLRKQDIVTQSMTYDIKLNATESLVTCDAVWEKTQKTTPGFENPVCEVIPTVTPTSSPDAQQKTNESSESQPTYQPAKSMPTVILMPIQPSIQSFSNKHKPQRLYSTTPTATIQPTFPPIIVDSPKRQGYYALGVGLIMSSLVATSYLLYRLARTMKDEYNDHTYDS